MERQALQQLLRGLSARDPKVRETIADEVTDIHKCFSDEDLQLVVEALVSARLQEANLTCQEAQLNALAELKAWHGLAKSWLVPLAVLSPESLPGSQREYIEELFDHSED